MFSNASCTLYSPVDSRAYSRTVINGVWWEETSAINIQKFGISNANKATVNVPITAIAPKANDYLVKGEIDFIVDGTAGHTITDLLKSHNALKVISADTYDYGSVDLQHYEVSLK